MLRNRCFTLIVATVVVTLGLLSGCPQPPPPDIQGTQPTPCTSRDHKQCVSGNVHWFDSCGNRGSLAEQCFSSELCVDNGGSPRCVECTSDADCDDGLFCNGTEACFNGNCSSSSVPCAFGETCNDITDTCDTSVSCTTDADCDDGSFCNGVETCDLTDPVYGVCVDGTPPCASGQTCDEGTRDCSGAAKFEMDYFEHARVAQEEFETGNIPTIIQQDGNVLTLLMPAGQSVNGWAAGTVILVQDLQGQRFHKYVLYATQLTVDTARVLTKAATLLSAINNVSAPSVGGKLIQKPGTTEKVIVDGEFDFTRTIDLSSYNIDLGDHATINWIDAGIEFDFTTTARLEINSVVLEVIDAGVSWISNKATELAARVAAQLDDGVIDSEEDMRLLEQRLDNDAEFRSQVDDILNAMEDPNRVKEASVTIDGTITGIFQPEFVLSASTGNDWVYPILPQDILIQLGPLPAQATINVSLVLGASIDGELRVTTGLEFAGRLHAEANWNDRVANGSLSPLAGWNDKFFKTIAPTFDAEGGFSLKVGIQPEIGLTLFKVVGFTVNPELYARLEGVGTATQDCVELSAELFGGVDASVRGEALIWSTNEYSFFNAETSLLAPFDWENPGCRGSRIANAGPDQTISPGGSTTLNGSATGGVGGYAYVWSPTTGLDNAFIANPTASPTTTTTYTLTVFDTLGEVGTDTVLVTVTNGTTPTGETVTLDLGGGVTMELVRIPAGSFMMGSENGFSDERPVHSVTISRDFYIGRYEVTQAQWRAVMGNNPSSFSGCDTCPVERVSWGDIAGFNTALSNRTGYGLRLPTEAEWEYAARAGTTTEYSFGDDSGNLGDYAWYGSNSGWQTHEVGGKLPNPWGLYDMHGNVWEWCEDWYSDGYYAISPGSDPTGPVSGSGRVLRGGSWDLDGLNILRSAHRSGGRPGERDYRDGFRVASGT